MSELLYGEPFREQKIDGKIYLLSTSTNPKHGIVIGNVFSIFKDYLKKNNIECHVYNEP